MEEADGRHRLLNVYGFHCKLQGYRTDSPTHLEVPQIVSLSFIQLKKQGRTVRELKRRVLKLEFCLEESWSHVRKLHRIATFINLICETYNSSMSFCYAEAEHFLCGKCAQGIAKQLVRVAISESARKR